MSEIETLHAQRLRIFTHGNKSGQFKCFKFVVALESGRW